MNQREKKRYHDLIAFREWEVKWAAGSSILLLLFFLFINLYDDFYYYKEGIANLIICFIGAMLGLLGFALSGIAIIVSLYTKEELMKISEINGDDVIADILTSYCFLAKNIAFQCMILFVLYFLNASKADIIPMIFFYILVWLETYHISFIILYTVALVGNCIKLYRIKNIYSKMGQIQKNIHDEINEIKIDYIFSLLINIHNFSEQEIIEDLIGFIEESSKENKEELIKYIRNQYNASGGK